MKADFNCLGSHVVALVLAPNLVVLLSLDFHMILALMAFINHSEALITLRAVLFVIMRCST